MFKKPFRGITMNQHAPEFLQPQYFFPMFVGMWVGVSILLSFISGWASLAKDFKTMQDTIGKEFRYVSGSMGIRFFPVNYGNCLFVTVNEQGFELSVLFLFRVFSPKLFIPWKEVESVKLKRILVFHNTVVKLSDHWPTISISGKAGKRLFKEFENIKTKSSTHGLQETAKRCA